ncbi:hypothetical protein F5Y05DRAFT_301178 [Hypoxylon sp. FL0543]|nr:hypothetical protein F5Y05DRAFT_301178 [Hypoxylon sp. FL0543]
MMGYPPGALLVLTSKNVIWASSATPCPLTCRRRQDGKKTFSSPTSPRFVLFGLCKFQKRFAAVGQRTTGAGKKHEPQAFPHISRTCLRIINITLG